MVDECSMIGDEECRPRTRHSFVKRGEQFHSANPWLHSRATAYLLLEHGLVALRNPRWIWPKCGMLLRLNLVQEPRWCLHKIIAGVCNNELSNLGFVHSAGELIWARLVLCSHMGHHEEGIP